MSIVMLIVMSRSVNKAYFWGKKQLQVFNIIILHQFGVIRSALAIFCGIYNCKSYSYLFWVIM